MEHAGATRYLLVWAVLVVLTAATYLLSRVELGPPWHLLVAIGIASAKAGLVALFFMHLWEHGGATRLVFATSLVFVALLIGLVVADNATRFPLANPPREATLRFEPPQLPSPLPEPEEGRLPR
jgi:cytochrome c oxidase subunit 4